MENPSDLFIRRAIKFVSSDIHEDVLVKLREKARGKPLTEQFQMIIDEAMKTYQEPELLRLRREAEEAKNGNTEPSNDGSHPVSVQRDILRSVQGQRIGKDAAAGRD